MQITQIHGDNRPEKEHICLSKKIQESKRRLCSYPLRKWLPLGTVRFEGAATRVLRLCLHPVLSNQYHQLGRLNSNYADTQRFHTLNVRECRCVEESKLNFKLPTTKGSKPSKGNLGSAGIRYPLPEYSHGDCHRPGAVLRGLPQTTILLHKTHFSLFPGPENNQE